MTATRGCERARLESSVARAHRAVYYAMTAAQRAGHEGAEEDLRQLLAELTRIGHGLLSPGERRALEGQPQLW